MFLVHRTFLLKHVLHHGVTDSNRIHALWYFVMNIWDKVSVFFLLKIEVLNIDPVIGQIGVELRLLWKSTLIDLLAKEGVLS